MKIEIPITHYESYKPYKCHNLRYNKLNDIFNGNIREVNFNCLKKVLKDKIDNVIIYQYKNKLYKKFDNINNIDNIINIINNKTILFSENISKDDVIKICKKELKKYIIVNDNIYKEIIGKPFIRIFTYGFGNNLGYTTIKLQFISALKKEIKNNSNICFNLIDYEIAKQTAIEMAKKRGDSNSIETLNKDIIEIYDFEYINEILK